MHQHVDAELRGQATTATPGPALPCAQDLYVPGTGEAAYIGMEGLGPPDGWVDAMMAPTSGFWSWDTNSMVEGLPGGGFNAFGEFGAGAGGEEEF